MIYYNENNKFAVSWLEKLMQEQLIPQGVIDRRSITEIQPNELKNYTQCHFFAGIGGWSYALELTGWDVSRPVWTGSCPCQPFSEAGKNKGYNDERDLWPTWFKLIQECKPPTIFGEQVESAIKHGWLDRLSDDLEAQDYAVGSAVLPACSVGAPHQRKRLWWVANSNGSSDERRESNQISRSSGDGELANTNCERLQGVIINISSEKRWDIKANKIELCHRTGSWIDAEYIQCTDGKFRPIEPSIRLLVDGFPSRVGLLRGFGNAIVPQVAAEFIKAFMEF